MSRIDWWINLNWGQKCCSFNCINVKSVLGKISLDCCHLQEKQEQETSVTLKTALTDVQKTLTRHQDWSVSRTRGARVWWTRARSSGSQWSPSVNDGPRFIQDGREVACDNLLQNHVHWQQTNNSHHRTEWVYHLFGHVSFFIENIFWKE